MKRRTFIKILLSSTLVATIPLIAKSQDTSVIEDEIVKISGDYEIATSQKIHITAPIIAENQAVVPIKIRIDSPMQEDDYVEKIYILRSHASNCKVAETTLTPNNGKAYFSTRIKLLEDGEYTGGRYTVIVIAKLSNGVYIKNSVEITTLLGSC